MAGPFSLSLAAVDVLSQTLEADARLFPFEIPYFGQFQSDRRRIAAAVFTDLAKRKLIREGEIDPDLRRAMHTLSHYRIAVAAMGTVGEEDGKNTREIFARASATAETGVLAVQDGQRLRLELIRPTALAMTMVGLLPKAEAGPGQSVNITKPAPVGARRHRDTEERSYFENVRGPRGNSDQAMRIAESYLTRPRTGAGFFAVMGRDRHGKEIRAGEVGWMDTDAGRYLTLSRPPGEDGQIHGTFSPADAARLTQQISQLIDSVAPRN
jgi:hypothetical protein